MRHTLACLAVLSLVASLRADVTPAPVFTDNAVLQRDKPVPVWGTASAGEKVAVTFAGQTLDTTADASGKWRVDLPPQSANPAPADLVIKGNNTLTLTNIVVGEVWLASGQSNMEWLVKRSPDSARDIPASANPLIRHLKIAKKISDTPITTASGAWEVAGPDTTGDFSAVAYYFARHLQEALHVPVGIINSSWGGTEIEPWISAPTLARDPAFAVAQKRWSDTVANYPAAQAKYEAALAAWQASHDAATAAGKTFATPAPRAPAPPDLNPQKPAVLYNGMIHPLAPCAFRGALWYQGESNTGRANEYHALLSALIRDWRATFAPDGQPSDFPFYWVQLPNFNNFNAPAQNLGWPRLREAQANTLAVPNTGQAVAIDIGEDTQIHPKNKPEVGRRLALVALARTYGLKIVSSGPVFAQASRDGAGFRVSFTEINGGLSSPKPSLVGFELAGADKVFRPADAVIENDTVLVTSADVPAPVAVRYAWRNAALAGLFNKEGLPAAPFRTDTW